MGRLVKASTGTMTIMDLGPDKGTHLPTLQERIELIVGEKLCCSRAWLVRFGRTAAGHAADAIGARFGEGGGGSHATFAGLRLWGAGRADGAGAPSPAASGCALAPVRAAAR